MIMSSALRGRPAAVPSAIDRWRFERLEKEIAKVATLLEQDVGDRRVQLWDWNYYDTQIRKTEYGVDPMKVATNTLSGWS